MKGWEAVPLPILSWIVSYRLPIPCGLTVTFPCGKERGKLSGKFSYRGP